MNFPNPSTISGWSSELAELHQELQQRDQLIEQLSHQLYESLRGATPEAGSVMTQPSSGVAVSSLNLSQQPTAPTQPDELLQQIDFYQRQIAGRDAEVLRLQQANQELVERNQMLEKVIQELPEVYRQKFAERLAQVKTRIEILQQENQQLQADLQQINAILSGRNRLSPVAESTELPPLPAGPTHSGQNHQFRG